MDSAPIQPSISISSLLHNPSFEKDPVAHAEKQVEQALDDLVTVGALQKKNRMDIKTLLNLASKSHTLEGASDGEIYQAVIGSIAAKENMEINGSDDSDVDDPIEQQPDSSLVQLDMMFLRLYQPSADTPMAQMIQLHTIFEFI